MGTIFLNCRLGILMLAILISTGKAHASPQVNFLVEYHDGDLIIEQSLRNWPLPQEAATEFTLNSHYKILQINPKPLEIRRFDDQKVLIRLGPQNHYSIRYLIPNQIREPSQRSFYQEDSWYLNPMVETKSVFSMKIESSTEDPELHFIHSATPALQDGISAMLGKFRKYERVAASGVRLQIYLIQPDENFAKILLGRLEEYLLKYESLIGPYPYDHFAVVENEDPTGYAFPTMTWIGSQILHFPFILTTSLPHELLHSWWGNGVFVDTEFGNWCEGLTTYLADYHFQPTESAKADYRLKQLIEYENYANSQNEISLAEFRSRGEDRSLQAIGYGKSMFVFLMLENQIGKEIFAKLLKGFYEKYRGREASFRDFFALASQMSGQNLEPFFDFWVRQRGALDLTFLSHKLVSSGSDFLIESTLRTKDGLIDGQLIPLKIQVKETQAWQSHLSPLRTNQISTRTETTPAAVWYDANFELFRKLYPEEKPSVLSDILAKKQLSVALFSHRDVDQKIMEELSKLNGRSIEIIDPSNLDFHSNQNLVLVGSFADFWLSRYESFTSLVTLLSRLGIELTRAEEIRIANGLYSTTNNALILAVNYQGSSILLILSSETANGSRIVQRMAHYGAQSFALLSPTAALVQGLWQGLDSALRFQF